MLFTIWNGDMSCAAGIRFREIFYLPDPFLLPHLKAKRDFTSQYYSYTYLPSWSLASRLSCLETTFFFSVESFLRTGWEPASLNLLKVRQTNETQTQWQGSLAKAAAEGENKQLWGGEGGVCVWVVSIKYRFSSVVTGIVPLTIHLVFISYFIILPVRDFFKWSNVSFGLLSLRWYTVEDLSDEERVSCYICIHLPDTGLEKCGGTTQANIKTAIIQICENIKVKALVCPDWFPLQIQS